MDHEERAVPENDAVEKALRLFVYAPVGFAAYLRDSGPSLLDIFVARGRREVEGARRAVEGRLGLAEPEPLPPSPFPQRLAGGLGRIASQAGSAVVGVARPVVDAATSAPTEARPVVADGSEGNGSGAALPIPAYDGLSATQVIDRLDGLSRSALERIRHYELAHRARRTILASIDQLTS